MAFLCDNRSTQLSVDDDNNDDDDDDEDDVADNENYNVNDNEASLQFLFYKLSGTR